MTNQHPITPSPELVERCLEMIKSGTLIEDVCRVAAQWGADQELDACSLLSEQYGVFAAEFRAARLAKPPSLKEQALSYEEKFKLAINPNTPAEILNLLATDDDWRVRWRVARNPNTPTEILKVLATDDSYYVRLMVARNRSTPPEALPND